MFIVVIEMVCLTQFFNTVSAEWYVPCNLSKFGSRHFTKKHFPVLEILLEGTFLETLHVLLWETSSLSPPVKLYTCKFVAS